MKTADLILELCALPGPAGYEEAVGARVRELLAPYMDEVWTDTLGNVIGLRRCGRDNAKKLLFDAHMDEIGFIVTGHEEGFVRFAPLGGVDARPLPAAEIRLLADMPVVGVTAVLPPHVLRPEESDKVMKIDDLYIDVGLGAEAAQQAVPVGTPAVYNTEARMLNNDSICGKALDDRAGLACVLRALSLLKDARLDVDLYVLASVQEELGTRGAHTGAFSIAPDWCIAVDADHARTPDSGKRTLPVSGGGAVVTLGPNMDRRLTELLLNLARDGGIGHQISVEPGDSGTNLRAIQVSRGGVATALLGLPVKYMHTPVETARLSDAEDIAALLCAAAKALKGDDSHA